MFQTFATSVGVLTMAWLLQVKPVTDFTVAKAQEKLSALGYSCKGPKHDDKWLVWNCEKGKLGDQSYMVDVTGDASKQLLSISIHSFPGRSGTTDMPGAIRELSGIAALEYRGAKPDEVQKWLQDSVSGRRMGAELEVGGVVFYLLNANPPNLDISVKGW